MNSLAFKYFACGGHPFIPDVQTSEISVCPEGFHSLVVCVAQGKLDTELGESVT